MTGRAPPIDAEVLLSHAAWIRRLARGLVVGEDQIDDVTQQAWLKALRHPPREGGNLRAWWRRVVRNIVRDRTLADGSRVMREQAAARKEEQASAEDIVQMVELQRRVSGAVLGLKEPYRSVVLLRFYQDLPLGEIARRQNVPLETVRTRLKRALARLRARLLQTAEIDWTAWLAMLTPQIDSGTALRCGTPDGSRFGQAMPGGVTVGAGTKIATISFLGVVAIGIAVWQLLPGSPSGPSPSPLPAQGTATLPGPPGMVTREIVEPVRQAQTPERSPSSTKLAAGGENGSCRLHGKILGRWGSETQEYVSWSTDWASPGGYATLYPDGTYELADLPPGRYRLCYRGNGILPTYYLLELREGDNQFDIEAPVCRLSGRIVGAIYTRPSGRRGHPGPGDIQIIPRGTTCMSGNRLAFVFADENGCFAVDHVPPGEYIVRWKNGWVAKPTIQEGQTEVLVELRAPEDKGSIAGTITLASPPERTGDASLARPIGVHAFPKDEHGYDITVWNSQYLERAPCRYEITDLPVGTYAVFVTVDRTVSAVSPRVFVPDVEVKSGECRELDLLIPAGRPVQLAVDFPNGKPSSVRWDLVYPNGGRLPDQAFIGSSAEGFYALPINLTLPVGTYRLELMFDEEPMVQQIEVVPGEGPLELRIDAPATVLASWPERFPRRER
ncbi:MAG: RNA polymerase sigma factor [Planctomycetota bacterium]